MRHSSITFVVLVCILALPICDARSISYVPCDATPLSPGAVAGAGAEVSIDWSTVDADPNSSHLAYEFCSRRRNDLRYASDIRLTTYDADSSTPTMSRILPICVGDEKHHACLNEITQSGCLSGTSILRIPLPIDGHRSEVSLTEGGASSTLFKMCSV